MLGFNNNVIVFPEVTYGVAPTDFETTMTMHNALSLNYELGKEQINQVVRNGSLGRSECEIKAGRQNGTVTLAGRLTKENSPWLFAGITLNTQGAGTTASPWTVEEQGAKYSYTIMRYDSDADTADIFAGATMSTLSLSSSGVEVMFDATFRTQPKTEATDVSAWTGTKPVATCEEDVLFSALTIANTLIPSFINSITLTLTNEFAPDNQLFQNSTTKAKEVCIGTTGQMSVSYIYDSALGNDAKVLEDAGVSVVVTTLSLTGYSLVIRNAVKLINVNVPDPEKGQYEGTSDFELITKTNGSSPLYATLIANAG